ncbi:MAG: protein kinase [Planctomycetota bacterium]
MSTRDNNDRTQDADRNLLFGILAWQAGALSEPQLLAAMQTWTGSDERSLGTILVQQSFLTREQLDQLNQMVDAYLRLHDGQAQKALSSFSSVPGITVSLKQQVDDSAIQASLKRFSTERELETEASSDIAIRANLGIQKRASGESRYRIVRPHARGGLGEVFIATDTELNREVAIKEIQSRFADEIESRGRFVLEAEVTGGLEHPGIVPVYGLGQYDDGRPYYAMRFIKGDSLKDAIKEFHGGRDLTDSERNLELRKLLGRFTDVCEAIGYAHSRGVLHRDLKPGNIMLGKYGETLVVDWGLAKVAGTDNSTRVSDEQTLNPSSGSGVNPTMVGSAIGTPAYMPPEQASGRLNAVGPASDVYSLGATLYHLLTGVAPFSNQDLASTLKNVQLGNFTRPREANPKLSPLLEAICLKAMSVEPADRYESPQALALDIERFLADEPVTAVEEPISVRAKRWIRKNQTLVATAATIVLMAMVATGVFFRLSQQQALRDKRNADLIAEQAKESARMERDFASKQSQLRLDADGARDKAETALAMVQTRESELRESLTRNLLGQGVRASRSGDYINGLLSFAEAYRTIGEDDSLQQSALRLIDGWNEHDLLNFYHPSLTYGDDLSGTTVELNRDGSRLVTRCVGGFTFIWNAKDGSLIAGPMNAKHGFRLDPTGQFVVTSLGDRRIRFNSLLNGQFLWETSSSTVLEELAFSKDGQQVAMANRRKIVLHRTKDGQPLADPIETGSRITTFAFDEESGRIAAAGGDQKIRFWDSNTGQLLGEPIAHTGILFNFKFVGKRCVALDNEGVQLFSINGKPIGSRNRGYLRLGPDDRYIVLSSTNRSRLIDVEDATIMADYSSADAALYATLPFSSFNPDGTRIVLANSGNTKVFVAELTNPEAEPVELPIRGNFLSGAWDQSGQHFLTISTEQVPPSGSRQVPENIQSTILRAWHAGSSEAVGPPIFLDEGLPKAYLLGTGQRIVTATSGGIVRVWDTMSGKPVSTPVNLGSETGQIQKHPEDDTLIFQCRDRTVRLLRLSAEEQVAGESRFEMTSAAMHPKKRIMATATEGAWAVQLRSTITGRLVGTPMQQGGPINDIAFGPVGQRVATAGNDYCAYVWDVDTQSRLAGPLWHRGRVLCVAFGEDENQLVTGTDRGEVVLWDCQNGKRLAAASHLDAVRSIAVDAKGQRLLTGSDDETARVWDLATLKPLSDPLRHSNPVGRVCFDSAGAGFLTATSNIRFWNEDYQQIGVPLQLGSPAIGLSLSDDGDELLAVTSNSSWSIWDPLSRLPLGPTRSTSYGVRSIGYSTLDKGFSMVCSDGQLRSFRQPRGFQPDRKQLLLWLKVLTTLDSETSGRERLSFEQWFEARQALDGLPTAKRDRPSLTVQIQLTPGVESKELNRNVDRVRGKLRTIISAMYRSSPSQDFGETRLPAYASFDKDGKPLLSWRVHLLPELGLDTLYKRFHLDEPWDSEHNLRLLKSIPQIYVHPSSSVSREGKTCFVAVRGKGTCFNEANGVPFAAMRDGTSFTVAIVTVNDAHAVPWTQPNDIDVMSTDPRGAMSGWIPGRCQVAFADGSTTMIPCGAPEKIFPLEIFRRYFTYADKLSVPMTGMPTFDQVIDELFEQAAESQDWRLAIEYLSELVSSDPSNPEFQDLLVEGYISSNDWDRAQALLRQLYESNADPHANWWAYQLSIASLATNRLDTHRDLCRSMFDTLDSESDPYHRMLTAFAAAAVPGTLSTDAYLRLADQLQASEKQSAMAAFLRAGRFEDSLSMFRSISDLGRADSFCWTIAALNHAMMGDREKATAAKTRALALKRRETVSSWTNDQVFQTLQHEIDRLLSDDSA